MSSSGPVSSRLGVTRLEDLADREHLLQAAVTSLNSKARAGKLRFGDRMVWVFFFFPQGTPFFGVVC